MASQNVGNLAVILTANAAGMRAGFDQGRREVTSYAADARRGLSAVGDGLKFGVGFAAGAAGLSSLVGTVQSLAREGMRLAGVYEEAGVAFEVMTGSAKTGQNLLREARQFALNSPFDPAEVVQYSRQLLGVGIASHRVIPTLSMLGDVAAGTGGDLGRIATAFGQVVTKGRLYSEELLQLSEAGVGAKVLADGLGLSTMRFRMMVEAGKVGSRELQKAFEALTGPGGRFFDLQRRLNDTLPRQFALLGKNIVELTTKAMDEAAKEFGLAGGLKDLNRLLSDFGRLKAEARLATRSFISHLLPGPQTALQLHAVKAYLQEMEEANANAAKNATPQEQMAAWDIGAAFRGVVGGDWGDLGKMPPALALEKGILNAYDFYLRTREKVEAGGFDIFKSLRDGWKEFEQEVAKSPLFTAKSPLEQFAASLDMIRAAAAGKAVGGEAAEMANARAFLDLEKAVGGSEKAPANAAKSRDSAEADAVIARWVNAGPPRDVQERIRTVLERANDMHQRASDERKAIAAALKQEKVEVLSLP